MAKEILLEKELQTIFNHYKIRLNPTDYNLKDRVLLSRTLVSSSMAYTDTSIIDEIIDKINSRYTIRQSEMDIKDMYTKGLAIRLDCVDKLNDLGLSLVLDSNIYIEYNRLLYDVVIDKPVEKLKKTFDDNICKYGMNFMKFYIISMVLCNLNNSLNDTLVYAHCKLDKDYEGEALKSCRFLNDYLEDVRLGKATTIHIRAVNSYGAPKLICKNVNCYNYESDLDSDAIRFMYAEALMYSAELFNNVFNSKLTQDEKDEFVKVVLDINKDIYKDMVINDMFYDYESQTFREDVQKIIDCTNLNIRYELLNEYLENCYKRLDTLSKSNLVKYHNEGKDYFPDMLATIVQTLRDTSERTRMIKCTLKLLEFCKKEGIKLELEEALSSDTDLSFPDTESTENSIKSSLVNRSRTKYSDTKAPKSKDTKLKPSKPKPTHKSNDILDKAISEFSENSYNYRVEYKKVDPKAISQTCKDNYNTIVSNVKLLNKTLIKRIKDIKTYNVGGKNPGLTRGKLDPKRLHLYKTTPNIFYNNTYKIKESDLAFGVLLDVSGSMRGEGVANGKITMILLHETLKALGINHCIVTHNSNYDHECNICKYQPFKEDKNYTVDKCYNLIDIEAYGGNCDSGALYYMEKELNRVRNTDKICIMFSDGEPTECTGTELKEQIQRMERKGIRVIGVGIGYESIKEYYPHNANGNTLKEMIEIVTNILKEYVLEKAE